MGLPMSVSQREVIQDKDPFCQRDMPGIPTMPVTECALLVLASLPDAKQEDTDPTSQAFHDIQVTRPFNTTQLVQMLISSYVDYSSSTLTILSSSRF
ncbi:Nf-Kappa-B Inhibitor Zeta [Manis pentadactyla]|nr:Nf-Kappa-B Inhibitor Zeta [Manis pentadactyla]